MSTLEWEKLNVTRVSLKFMNSTDRDIIEYLADKPKQATIKKALREMIAREKSGGKEQ